MGTELYRVVFNGELLPGRSPEDVKAALAGVYKNPATVESFFSGKTVVIKKKADQATCQKVVDAFKRAGAICSIQKEGGPPPLPPLDKPAAGPGSGLSHSDRPQAGGKSAKDSIANGQPLTGPDEIPCPTCGKIIRKKARICHHCGIKPNASSNTAMAALFICAGIIAVIAVVGILAAIAIPNFIKYRERAQMASINEELERVKDAQGRYFEKYGKYTTSMAALNMYITTPGIAVEIVSADGTCFRARGRHLERKLESWIDCNGLVQEETRSLSSDQWLASGPKTVTEPLFSPPEGDFSVFFPGEPSLTTQDVSTPVGKITVNMYLYEKREYACLVGYSDYPNEMIKQVETRTLLDGAVNGAMGNVKGKVESQQDISLGIHVGREIEFSFPPSAKMPSGGNGKARFFMVGSRLYQLVMVGRNVRSSSETDHFLNSFALSSG